MKVFKHLPTKPKLIVSIKKRPYIRRQHYNPYKEYKDHEPNKIIQNNIVEHPYIDEIFTRVSEYYITNLILNSKNSILSKLKSNYFKMNARLIFDYLEKYNKDFISHIKKDLFTVSFATLLKESMHMFDPSLFSYTTHEGDYDGFEGLKKLFEDKKISKDTYKLLLDLDNYFSKEFEFYKSALDDPEEWSASDVLSWTSLRWFFKFLNKNKQKYNLYNVINDLYNIFYNDDIFWASKYGGEAYQKITKLLKNYIEGELSDTAFVESIFNIYHNTGMLLGKYEEWNRFGLLDYLPEFFDKRQKANNFLELFYKDYLSYVKKVYKAIERGYAKPEENPFFYNHDLMEKFWLLSYYIDQSSKTKYRKIINYLREVFFGDNNLIWTNKQYLTKLIKLLDSIK